MKTSEPDEPGSDDYNSKQWRRARNEKTIQLTQPLKNLAGSSKWDRPNGFFHNGSQPRQLCFHQFEDHLAVADAKDGIWYVYFIAGYHALVANILQHLELAA